jgi:hypothetical protein
MPVHAVRDGWVIAAGLKRTIQCEGVDFGSASFVLVHHSDQGVQAEGDARAGWTGQRNSQQRSGKNRKQVSHGDHSLQKTTFYSSLSTPARSLPSSVLQLSRSTS